MTFSKDKAVDKANPAGDGKRSNTPLYDYGKLYRSDFPYDCFEPTSIQEVRQLLAFATATSRRVRVRGSGHTFNGCTLPRESETLVRTRSLDWYRFDQPGTLTVGAGALVWDVRDLIQENGFDMPVYNGGWAGPSIGGYISAGGFGKGSLSDAFGGLWENVLNIKLVDAQGDIHQIDRADERFRWIFGSYGQLGIIVEAKLKLIPKHPAAMLIYPRNRSGSVPRRQSEDPATNDLPLSNPSKSSEKSKTLFWFSLLVSQVQEAPAWAELAEFCIRHRDFLKPDGGWAGPVMNGEFIGYRYNIRFHEFNPPLLYDRQEDFIVLGVMSFFDVSALSVRSKILTIEKDFIDLAQRNNLKLYLQAENIGRNIDYRAYYGEVVYQQFKALKHFFDPHCMINRGSIFGGEESPPP